jgi:formylmethanofuran dehydrogenase subunit E
MQTNERKTDRSLAAHLKRAHRCSVCGTEMTAPQSILSMDGTDFCDACYRDNFFDGMQSPRRQVPDPCDA